MGKRKLWSDEEREALRRDYPDTPTKELARRFGCSEAAIYGQAQKLGLHKSAAYLASPHACRLRRGDNVGAKYRFKKGQRPWNTGKKGLPVSERFRATQFRPGNKNHNWKPVGAERLMDGYLQRKMTDTGYPPRDWVGVHILLWQEHHGPVPEGHVVVFRNGNKADIRIENLELISRGELMRRNTIHNYPPALKDAIRLAAKLERTIRRKSDEKQDRGSAKSPVRDHRGAPG